MSGNTFRNTRQELKKATNLEQKIQLFKRYAQHVIAMDTRNEFDNYPWDKNDHDGFPHQSAAYELLALLLVWDYWSEDNIKPNYKDQIQIIEEIDNIVGNLELPPQYDYEPRNENHPLLTQREKDWQRVIELVNSL